MPDNERVIISDNDKEEFAWSVTDPLGHCVVLRNKTKSKHILNVATHTKEDIEFRTVLLEHAKVIVENPRYILEDNDYNINKRICYTDIIKAEGRPGMTYVSVHADTDREPFEVATIIPRRKTTDTKGAIIYDANDHRQK